MPGELKDLVGQPVRVLILRPAGEPCFTLVLDNGYTEELEPDDCRKWFKDHGVTEELRLENALDMAWNFYEHRIKIDHFQMPQVRHPAYEVQL